MQILGWKCDSRLVVLKLDRTEMLCWERFASKIILHLSDLVGNGRSTFEQTNLTTTNGSRSLDHGEQWYRPVLFKKVTGSNFVPSYSSNK